MSVAWSGGFTSCHPPNSCSSNLTPPDLIPSRRCEGANSQKTNRLTVHLLSMLIIAVVLFLGMGCSSSTAVKPDSEVAKTHRSEKPNSGAEPESTTTTRELTVAAASDLKFVLGPLIEEFQKVHPDVRVKPTFGSSGNFFAQLSNQAPFDLFLSADVGYPRKLIEGGFAKEDTLFSYAIGQIVVWARNESSLNVDALGVDVFKDPSIQKIAIANPKHAPYGRAAEAALKELGLYDQISSRLVLGENVAQAAQFAETGAADLGIISHSLVTAATMRGKGKYWVIPQSAYPPIEQAGVIVNWAKEKLAAEQFRDFLISERGRSILTEYGFTLPAKP